ncbi:MAG: hypothetical protein JNM35_03740 [Nitrospira sp.]|nr:hypothetical protein [Nitrospira sp.]MCS6265751.1 hypothetical protein [Nitrospira sp.]
MSATMSSTKQTGRSRVMIVDPELQFGLKLADCLATNGYHAVLVRDIQSMLTDLVEIQPEAILLSSDSCEEEREAAESDTLRALNILCPQAPVLTVAEPTRNQPGALSPPIDAHASPQTPPVHHRVEELLRATLGIPCVPASLT